MLDEVIISILSHYEVDGLLISFSEPSQLTGYLSWWSRDSRQTPTCGSDAAWTVMHFSISYSWFIDCIRPNVFFCKTSFVLCAIISCTERTKRTVGLWPPYTDSRLSGSVDVSSQSKMHWSCRHCVTTRHRDLTWHQKVNDRRSGKSLSPTPSPSSSSPLSSSS